MIVRYSNHLVALLLVISVNVSSGDFGILEFASAVKQQHARSGEVQPEWVLEQWKKVQTSSTKSWIETMNTGVDRDSKPSSSNKAEEGPELPPDFPISPPPTADIDAECGAHQGSAGPNLDIVTGRTHAMDERGPLLVHEVRRIGACNSCRARMSTRVVPTPAVPRKRVSAGTHAAGTSRAFSEQLSTGILDITEQERSRNS